MIRVIHRVLKYVVLQPSPLILFLINLFRNFFLLSYTNPTFYLLHNYNITKNFSQLNEKFKEDLFDNESETRTTINGIAILDGQEYSFKSITHIETEGKEVEEEYTFTLYKDSNSYVKINQEYEEERDELEKYYRYTIVDNGTKIYDYKLDYEKENDRKNETEINLTLNNFKYKIEEVKIEGITYLQVLVVEKDNMKLDSAYKVLFKKIISESGVSYELVE